MKTKEVVVKLRHKIIIPKPLDNHIKRTWKSQFLQENSNNWFCDVPNDFILDPSNTLGLAEEIKHFDICCAIIAGKLNREDLNIKDPTILAEIDKNLPRCYGMIHARYIISEEGLKEMQNKYRQKVFGTCPRVSCNNETLLPIGISSHFDRLNVKVLCPCCRKIYEPRPYVHIDGAFFGPNVTHILIGIMGLTNHCLNYRPFQRIAFGFRVYDKRFDPEYKDESKQQPYSSALISPSSLP